MSNLQVRSIPPELHAQLRERASRTDMSMSEYVIRLVRNDLALPLFDDWASSVRAQHGTREIDVSGALDAARDEYDPVAP